MLTGKHAMNFYRKYPRVVALENDTFLYPVDSMSLHVEFTIAFSRGIVLIRDVRNND